MSDCTAGARAARWLSRDLSALFEDLPRFAAEDAGRFHFDVVIVGSGYGGAMALDALAGYGTEERKPLRIAMLERGKEYLPGAFPSRMAELPGHVRYSVKGQGKVRGRETGLFDLRLGPDMGVVLANGLGGGSLINAGVLARPLPEVFAEDAWPAEIREDAGFSDCMNDVKAKIGFTTTVSFKQERADAVAKLGNAVRAEISVAELDDPIRGIKACNGCGDCATGCNFGAKLSVDIGPIADAVKTHDCASLRIVTGASVSTFVPDAEGWRISVNHTDAAVRRRESDPHTIRTRHLILCAGALGSTELLMRAREGGLVVSDCLGGHFSGNGDNIVVLNGTAGPTATVADEAEPFCARGHGPTITSTLDLRHEHLPMVIQDLAIPGSIRRLMEEVSAFGLSMDALTRYDGRRHGHDDPYPSPETLSKERADRSLVLAVIVREAAEGELVRADGAELGTLNVLWPQAKTSPALDTLHQELVARAARAHPAARVLAAPWWRPLPAAVQGLLGSTRGPVLTVHPLGGCRMAEGADHGVVNHLGQVFSGSQGTTVYKNLVVLDGAIVPTSLGINPCLTIAALSQRAACQLRQEWGFIPVAANPRDLGRRPVFRLMPASQTVSPTQFQLTEQMVMKASLSVDGTPCSVELELWTRPFTLDDVVRDDSRRVLYLDRERSRLRVSKLPEALPTADVPFGKPYVPETARNERLLLEAPLSGEMRLFTHEASTGVQRACRALLSFAANRGARDLSGSSFKGWTWKRVCQVLSLASRAGDRRLIEYHLEVGTPLLAKALIPAQWNVEQQCIRLTKTVTYERAANPTVQLLKARVQEFPRPQTLRVGSTFRVDLPYFGKVRVPLLRIMEQQDHARGLIDTASLLTYIGRTLLPLHAWTFRLPDRPVNKLPPEPRLPKTIPGVAPPVHVRLRMGAGVHALLTHYRRVTGTAPRPRPVLMIHGYSASGTTFAHEALPMGGLAGALCREGHDVWVLDLRSSSGLSTGDHAWTFEQMGCEDIPLAVDHIHRHYGGAAQVDVVAHCMGAAMLSLGLFGDWPEGAFRFSAERDAMPKRLSSIVFSQAGPALQMSAANTARAYLAQWLRQYLTLDRFAFRPSDSPGTWEDMLDRLLCAVPYPRRDFRRENPLWPWKDASWVAQRHRMDALFGITFDLQGVSDAVLSRIDEFFGPVHLETLAQTIGIARERLVVDKHDASPMRPEAMDPISHCRVLALHAECNGLIDVATRKWLLGMLSQKVGKGVSVLLPRTGHQDSLIGRNAPAVYRRIIDFLKA